MSHVTENMGWVIIKLKREVTPFEFSKEQKACNNTFTYGHKKLKLFIVSTYLNYSHGAHLRTTRLSLHN